MTLWHLPQFSSETAWLLTFENFKTGFFFEGFITKFKMKKKMHKLERK